MNTVNLICIGCPLGCPLTVEMEGNEVKSVAGNTCPRGDAYAKKELTNPTRIVTSTVRVAGGRLAKLVGRCSEAFGMTLACLGACSLLVYFSIFSMLSSFAL